MATGKEDGPPIWKLFRHDEPDLFAVTGVFGLMLVRRLGQPLRFVSDMLNLSLLPLLLVRAGELARSNNRQAGGKGHEDRLGLPVDRLDTSPERRRELDEIGPGVVCR